MFLLLIIAHHHLSKSSDNIPKKGKANTIIGHRGDKSSQYYGDLWKSFFSLTLLSLITAARHCQMYVLVLTWFLSVFVLPCSTRLLHPYACLVQGNKVRHLPSLSCVGVYAQQLYVWKLKSMKICNGWMVEVRCNLYWTVHTELVKVEWAEWRNWINLGAGLIAMPSQVTSDKSQYKVNVCCNFDK